MWHITIIHAHSCSHISYHAHTLKHTITFLHSHTHTHAHKLMLNLPLSLTHTFKHAHSNTHPQSHTLAATQTTIPVVAKGNTLDSVHRDFQAPGIYRLAYSKLTHNHTHHRPQMHPQSHPPPAKQLAHSLGAATFGHQPHTPRDTGKAL